MAFENLQYKLENFALYFHGGIRRSIIIFSVVILILIAPVYFLGKLASNAYAQTYLDLRNFALDSKTTIYDYDIGNTQRAILANGESVLYVAVSNKKNRDVGFYPWNYSIQILDKSGTILTPKENINSYLLPDDNKYIVARAVAGGVQMQILEEPGTQKVIYNPNANPLLTQPNVTVQNNRVIVDSANQDMKVSAILRNEDSRFIEKIDLAYFVRDSQDAIIFAGVSSFNGFKAGTERDFSITNLPLPAQGEPRTLSVLWSVNYLSEGIIKL